MNDYYIGTLLTEIPKHIRKALILAQKDQQLASIEGKLSKKDFIYPIFQFYINNNISAQNIINVSYEHKPAKLWETLFNGSNYYLKDRLKSINIFKHIIFSDYSQYEKCLDVCIDTHEEAHLEIQFLLDKKVITENIHNSFLQSNREIFNFLLENDENLKLLKQYYNSKGLYFIKNSYYLNEINSRLNTTENNFSEVLYASLFFNFFTTKKSPFHIKDDPKLINYQNQHAAHLSEKFITPEKYNLWIETHKPTTNNPLHFSKYDVSEITFLLYFMKHETIESIPYKNKLFYSWIKDKTFRHKIFESENLPYGIFGKHKKEYIYFFKSISSEEWQLILNKSKGVPIFSSSYKPNTFFQQMIYQLSKHELEDKEKFDILYIIKKIKHHNKILISASWNYLIDQFQSKDNKKILDLYWNTQDLMTENLSPSKMELLSEYIHWNSNILTQLKIFKYDTVKIKKKLSTIFNRITENHFKETNETNKENLTLLSKFITNFELQEQTSINLNFLADKIVKTERYLSNGKTKGLEKIPFLFLLAAESHSKELNLKILNIGKKVSELKYKNMGFLEFLIDKNEHIAKETLLLLESSEKQIDIFHNFIGENPRIIEKIHQIESPEINSIIDMIKLKSLLDHKKSYQSIYKKNKI